MKGMKKCCGLFQNIGRVCVMCDKVIQDGKIEA